MAVETHVPPATVMSSPSGTAAGMATVVFLGITCGVQMSDRGLHSILSPAIREAFGVGDTAMGALHGIAGILIASALAIPLARLADRHSRKRILLALIAAWAGLTALGALAPNFPMFFLGRAAAGVTEFAMVPIVYSLIPDLVSERARVGANLGFAALMAVGASAGFYFAPAMLAWAASLNFGGMLSSLAPWRKALLLLALIGIPLLLLGALTRDPRRLASAAEAAASGAGLPAYVRSHLRPLALFVGTAGGLAVAVQALAPMIAMAVQRRFGTNLRQLGESLGEMTLFASLVSLPTVWLVDRLLSARFGAAARPLIMAMATTAALPCAALLAGIADARVALRLTAVFLLATCVANALLPTLVQDLFPAQLRARAFAAYSFLIATFCALGPLLSGGLSQLVLKDNLLLAIALTAAPALAIALVCAVGWTLDIRRQAKARFPQSPPLHYN